MDEAVQLVGDKRQPDGTWLLIDMVAPDGASEPALLSVTGRGPITFDVRGPGQVIGVDNGNPLSHEPFQSNRRRAFNGLCLAIVRTRAGKPGVIVVSAQAEGLKPGRLSLKSRF